VSPRRIAIAIAAGALAASGLTAASSARVGAASRAFEPQARVAFSVSPGTSYRRGWLETIGLDGTGRTQITQPPAAGKRLIDYVPTWAPDGSRLAFVRQGRDAPAGVYLTSPDAGGVPRRVVAVPQDRESGYRESGYPAEIGLDWSPDGTRLAFDRWTATECRTRRRVQLRFTVAAADGSAVKNLRALPHPRKLVAMSDPQWSPPGDKLLYLVLYAWNDHGECGYHDIPSSLYVMSADGTKRSRVAASKYYAISSAVWSSDGRKIAYVTCDNVDDEGCVLFVVDVDGRHRHKVLKELTSTTSVAWVANEQILLLDDQKLQTFNPSTRRRRMIAHGFGVFDQAGFIGFSRSGDQVAIVGYYPDRTLDAEVRWYDLRTRTRLGRFLLPSSHIFTTDVFLP
jgi:dipeptidyl aminopeptidase/acylaminoacyl peptidase